MYYRRNSDSQLRSLERKYSISPDRELLAKIDAIRLRMGLPPHTVSRVTRAKELLDLWEVRCLQQLREVINTGVISIWSGEPEEQHPLITADFEEYEGGNPYSQIIQNIIDRAQEMFVLRREADNDVFAAMQGLPPEPAYMELAASRGINLQGDVPNLANAPENSFAPGLAAVLSTSDASARLQAIETLRNEADHTCYMLLAEAAQLGFLSYERMLEMVGDEEEALYLYQEVQEELNACRLANDEMINALLGRAPDPRYVEELAEDKWYTI